MMWGCGGALMAWRLAQERARPYFYPKTVFGPCGTLEDASSVLAIYRPEIEYYDIVKRVTKAWARKSFCPMCTNPTVHV